MFLGNQSPSCYKKRKILSSKRNVCNMQTVNSRKSVRWSAVPMPCLSRLCWKLSEGAGQRPRRGRCVSRGCLQGLAWIHAKGSRCLYMRNMQSVRSCVFLRARRRKFISIIEKPMFVELSYPQHLKCIERGTNPFNNANDP